MVDQTEPTMEEIVVALRETRRDVGRPPPFTVVPGRGMNDRSVYAAAAGNNRGLARGQVGLPDGNDVTTSSDITDLRDAEIERLLADNARCNERIMFLLKIIEHERASNAAAGTTSAAVDRDAILRDVKASLDAELRPVLLVLHRLLAKQQLPRAASSAPPSTPKIPRSATPSAPSGWIAEISRELDDCGEALAWKTPSTPLGDEQQPNLRQRMVRAFDSLRSRSGPGVSSLRRDDSRVSNDA